MISLVIPPLVQLNTPYPSTAFLARSLRRSGVAVAQHDFGIELVLRLFSKDGLAAVFDQLETMDALPDPAWRALALRRQHEAVIGPVVRFLQGRDPTLATRILNTPMLPRGPRLDAASLEGFGPLAVEDAARHLATLHLADLADLVTATIDPGFGLARYQAHLATGGTAWADIAARLDQTTLLDTWLDALTDTLATPVVGLSVPFPGTLVAALRMGRRLRQRGVYVVMGGGFVSTELRDVAEPALWGCIDALVRDDGEGPLRAILSHLNGGPDERHRTRTQAGWHDHPALPTPPEHSADYAGMALDGYLQLIDGPNPAHRLWSDGRWNKVMVAHGCYWKKCSFCDITLPYIADYRPADVVRLVDEMEEQARVTGQTGFHLVDEAAPPARLRAFALEILRRNLIVTWWGNVRFERAFTPDLARLLAASGCVALTGGLEVASDRLLAKMDKGVTIDQLVSVGLALRSAGILVHAYLMYGYPTQTVQETVDSMEIVRQLFVEQVIDSAFWHRFVLTRHSGIAVDAAAHGVRVVPTAPGFGHNDLEHDDGTGIDHAAFDGPLVRALAAWMRGGRQEDDVRSWFDADMPAPTVPPDRIRAARPAPAPLSGHLVWLGGDVLQDDDGLVLHTTEGTTHLRAPDWVGELLSACAPGAASPVDASAVVPRLSASTLGRLRAAGLVGI